MHHGATLKLFQYWTSKRNGKNPPMRADIAPAAIAPILGNTFILEESDAGITFRLAGTRLCAAFGRELRGHALVNIFAPSDRNLVAKAINATAQRNTLIVGEVLASATNGQTLSMEILLMPLADAQTRVLGSLQFFDQPYWLGATPLKTLELITLAHTDPNRQLASLANRPPVMMPQDTRADERAHIWHVLDGGKTQSLHTPEERPCLSVIDGGLNPN